VGGTKCTMGITASQLKGCCSAAPDELQRHHARDAARLGQSRVARKGLVEEAEQELRAAEESLVALTLLPNSGTKSTALHTRTLSCGKVRASSAPAAQTLAVAQRGPGMPKVSSDPGAVFTSVVYSEEPLYRP
jgi:hypothetical protein